MMSRSAVRQLALLLLLLLPFCSLAQNRDDSNRAYGAYGGGDNNTTSPAPQTNVTQPAPTQPAPTPPPPTPPQEQPQQQPNATAPSPAAAGNGNVTQPSPQQQQQQQQPNATAPATTGGGTGDNATAFLPITLNNTNSWTMNGRAHEQNNYLMQNTASRPICDVSIKAPITNGDGTRISSSYNVDLRNTTAGAMHFDLPLYLQKIWPGQIVSFGWILTVCCGI